MCFFSSRWRHTRCALVTGVQTCALPIWCRLLREHGLRLKAAFDPTAVPRALSNIYLEEYDAERRQGRMRLMGETLKAQWRDSVVGLCTDDYVSGSVAELWKQSDTVVYFQQIGRAHV